MYHLTLPVNHPTLITNEEAEATRKVIQAAPELLEALEASHKALIDLMRQIPNNESIADHDFSSAEIAEEKTIAILNSLKS